MTLKVEFTPYFEKSLLKLARRFPTVLDDLNGLIRLIETGNTPGDKIPHIEYSVFKVRLPNRSARKGKSGGFRVIYYVQTADLTVMITIYSKSDQTDISPNQLRALIEEYQRK